jgi:hypothetical protein
MQKPDNRYISLSGMPVMSQCLLAGDSEQKLVGNGRSGEPEPLGEHRRRIVEGSSDIVYATLSVFRGRLLYVRSNGFVVCVRKWAE